MRDLGCKEIFCWFLSANVMSFWEIVEKPSAQEMAKIQDKGEGISFFFFTCFILGLRMTIIIETRLLGFKYSCSFLPNFVTFPIISFAEVHLNQLFIEGQMF